MPERKITSNAQLLRVWEAVWLAPWVITDNHDFEDPETKALYEKWAVAWRAEAEIRSEVMAHFERKGLIVQDSRVDPPGDQNAEDQD